MTTDAFDDDFEAIRRQRRSSLGPLPASREIFDLWRAPREGTDNPTRMDNPVWAWLVRNRISAYAAVDAYEAESALVRGPAWCFDRFGQSETQLPDGRIVYVGGEHEDHYDPDFHIYNDVTVIAPDGEIAIYGYPKTVFPPTDFHSATLVGRDLYIIGRLGYPEDRRERIESIHVLDTDSYRIRSLTTMGMAPRWLHRHVAEVVDDGRSIRLSGGVLLLEALPATIENLDVWELCIATGMWTRIEHNPWPRWCLMRAQPAANALWQIRQLLWNRSVGWEDSVREDEARLATLLGPGAEPNAIEALYAPPLQHETPERDEDAFNVWHIVVDGVTVRYREEWCAVTITVEGDLPETFLDRLVEDLCDKLSRTEGHAYRAERIRTE